MRERKRERRGREGKNSGCGFKGVRVSSEGGKSSRPDLHAWTREIHQTHAVMGTRFATAIWKSKQCLFQFPNLMDRNQGDGKFHALSTAHGGPG